MLILILRHRPKAVKALLVISVVILSAFACFAVFKKIYPGVNPGDNIRGEDGSLIMGYYHNETTYRAVKNYDEVDSGHKREFNEKFEVFHSLYKAGFEDYRDEINSKYVNCMIGAGIGGLAALIILIFIITGSGRRKRIKEEMEIRDMFP
ncbi:MAG: hypothetical protein QGH40_12410 [bacterium]|nr:hypothetical protein [bacterium]